MSEKDYKDASDTLKEDVGRGHPSAVRSEFGHTEMPKNITPVYERGESGITKCEIRTAI